MRTHTYTLSISCFACFLLVQLRLIIINFSFSLWYSRDSEESIATFLQISPPPPFFFFLLSFFSLFDGYIYDQRVHLAARFSPKPPYATKKANFHFMVHLKPTRSCSYIPLYHFHRRTSESSMTDSKALDLPGVTDQVRVFFFNFRISSLLALLDYFVSL